MLSVLINSEQVETFYDCSDQSHKAMGVEILYHVIFGPVLPSHSKFQAFAEGFNLQTDNGFSMLQILYHKFGVDKSLTNLCLSPAQNSSSQQNRSPVEPFMDVGALS